MPTLEAGARAPDVSLFDLDGHVWTLSEALRSGPVLLVTWKTSCRTSRTTFPYLERLRVTYPGAGWQLWAVGQDPAEAIRAFLDQVGPISFPVLIDYPTYAVSKAFDPVATPTLYLIEPDGRIALSVAGFSKDALNEISTRLARELGVAPVVVAPPDDGNPPFRPG